MMYFSHWDYLRIVFKGVFHIPPDEWINYHDNKDIRRAKIGIITMKPKA